MMKCSPLWPLGIGFFLGLCTVSCQTTPEPESEGIPRAASLEAVTRQDPIAQHTVALVDPDPTVGQFCSGVVFGARFVLTAASCFQDEQRIPYVLFERLTPLEDEGYEDRGILIKIERAVMHESYARELADQYDQLLANGGKVDKIVSPNDPLNDLALAYLEAEVPAHYVPARLIKADVDLRKTRLFAAGYGCQSNPCDENDSELHKSSTRWLRSFEPARKIILMSGKNKGSCVGDSGGPVFHVTEKDIVLVSISTSGQLSCEAGLSFDTPVVPYRRWIEQAMSGMTQANWNVAGFRVVQFPKESIELDP
jgi:hypothetical protein